jgi:hypothetical protein
MCIGKERERTSIFMMHRAVRSVAIKNAIYTFSRAAGRACVTRRGVQTASDSIAPGLSSFGGPRLHRVTVEAPVKTNTLSVDVSDAHISGPYFAPSFYLLLHSCSVKPHLHVTQWACSNIAYESSLGHMTMRNVNHRASGDEYNVSLICSLYLQRAMALTSPSLRLPHTSH